MKIQLKKISDPSFLTALNELISLDVTIKKSYKLARLLKVLQDEIRLLDERRIELVTKFCDKDENGQPVIENANYKLTPENLAQFNIKYKELLEIEIDLNFEPIDLSDENIKIKPGVLIFLSDFIFMAE